MRSMIIKYDYMKYVKAPNFFCNLDWWYAKEAFLPLSVYKIKYGVEPQSIDSMFHGENLYTIHLWRHLVVNKYNFNTNEKYDKNCLYELLKKFVDDNNNKKLVYTIAIPSYKRENTLRDKTLKILQDYDIDTKKINIFSRKFLIF